ncbi:MAG: MaoC family dehydratase [Burkholderiaceae bacterium]|jgi:acyl dehydratase|nr:MAG: MaoC family dehydratase [Burkholderiaceae bacterium]
MKTFDTLAQLVACVGQEIVVSDWITITQQQIDQFAAATGDPQWIHVDVERAKKGPFGTTIAHGFLTLSLIAGFSLRSLKVSNVHMGINYGLNRVRFMSPVPVGSRLRSRMALQAATPIEGGQQLTWKITLECEGRNKPACVAEQLVRYSV